MGIPNVFGRGAVFGVRGLVEGGVCQCIDLCVGDRQLLPFQVPRGRFPAGVEAAADFCHVRSDGHADAGHADDCENAL